MGGTYPRGGWVNPEGSRAPVARAGAHHRLTPHRAIWIPPWGFVGPAAVAEIPLVVLVGEEPILPSPTEQAIVAFVATEGVVAATSPQHVGHVRADENVTSGSAQKTIVSTGAIDHVPPRPASGDAIPVFAHAYLIGSGA
jgi:hypothetical protein